MRRALITGITGQDGFWLTKLLLNKGYDVSGIVRRNSQKKLGRLELIGDDIDRVNIYWGDITDSYFIDNVIKETKPDEIYHLAAQSFVALSFTNPKYTYDVNIGGTLNIVNAIKEHSPSSKLYFAATSEMFGKVVETPQNENTPFYPRSPYGVSKVAGFWTIKNYRESYNLFMSNGILFNHESEVRGPEFVTRKISLGVANIYFGNQDFIELGNLDAKRDWGHAEDYVYGMWLILQHNIPDDFVLGTGEQHSVREFVEKAFRVVGIDIEWRGSGINEEGIDLRTGKTVVKVNPKFYRPSEVDSLLADYSKARQVLGWEPTISFDDLVERMVKHDMNIVGGEY